MRAVLAIAVAALAGCSPEIAPESYLCGPEQLCPDGQACNGIDNVCVSTATATPFACGADYEDVAGDDAPATAQPQGELPCVSPSRQVLGCLVAGDPGDYYRFATPSTCAGVKVRATLEFPVAFAAAGLRFAPDGMPPDAVEMPCPASRPPAEGHANRCFDMTLATGTSYVLGVALDGTGDCDGACAYNRYLLEFSLATP